MHKIKITAIRKADYKDLQEKYENPIQHACDIQEGQVLIANGWQRPEGSPLKKSPKWTNLQIPPESLEFEKW